MYDLPSKIFSGDFKEGHVQGIAVDMLRGYVYFSFTTVLIKTDLCGNLIGSVDHIAGHLGCITFDADRNKVYGSLELKHDAIGKDIIQRTGWDPTAEDAFYLVEFDCDKIVRTKMDAEKESVMRAVWLRDAVEDYNAFDEVSGKKHRYGCSGIDGTAYGVEFGKDPSSDKKIMVCYGIYEENDREDNDHQVILQYDPSVFDIYGKELCQESPHHSGPEHCEKKYFLYTGNTRWGVQNLEYDEYTSTYITAVYKGSKPKFPNHSIFFIDAKVEACKKELIGRCGEHGLCLTLADPRGEKKADIPGTNFPYGSTGVFSCSDGTYYFSHPQRIKSEKIYSSFIHKYRIGKYDEIFELI